MKKVYCEMEQHELGSNIAQEGMAFTDLLRKVSIPLAERMIEAGEEFGLEAKEDLNHPSLEGIGYYNPLIKTVVECVPQSFSPSCMNRLT